MQLPGENDNASDHGGERCGHIASERLHAARHRNQGCNLVRVANIGTALRRRISIVPELSARGDSRGEGAGMREPCFARRPQQHGRQCEHGKRQEGAATARQ